MMRRFRRHAVVSVVLAVLAAAVMLPGAEAQKVLNPGGFSLVPLGGLIKIRNTSFPLTPRPLPECSDGIDNGGNPAIDHPADPGCTSPDDDSELAPGFQPKIDPSFTGTIDAAGNVSIPTSGIVFPPAYVPVQDPFQPWVYYVIKATVIPTHAATGTLDPISGAANLRVRFLVKIEGAPFGADLGPNCAIGSSGSPIDINVLTTGTTNPPAPAVPISGIPYSATTGQARLVNNSFAVPGASGCGFLNNLNDIINQQIGLQSPAGNNLAVVDGRVDPVLKKGVEAKIVTDPVNPTGAAPLTVNFDGSTSVVAKGPATYLWEFPDGTTASGITAQKTFTAAGTQVVKLTVTDADGDSSVALRSVVVTSGSTTSTTASTTTTMASTTTTTASTTTTTQPTTTTTSSTTTTTQPTTTTTTTTTQPTTTTTSTTTTLPPCTSEVCDAGSVEVTGTTTYTNGGRASAGGVTVTRDQFGVVSVSGLLEFPGTNGGSARLSVNAQRFWIFQLWLGQVNLFDQGAGVSLSAPIFGSLTPAPGTNAVGGVSSWFTFGSFPNLIRPFTIRWSVDDVS
jgi:PKD repeat protein